MKTFKTFFLFIYYYSRSMTIHKAYKLDLSNNAILSMYEDDNDYMWFGTYDRLNLYNGKNMFVYRFEMDNKTLYSAIYNCKKQMYIKLRKTDNEKRLRVRSLSCIKSQMLSRTVPKEYTQWQCM